MQKKLRIALKEFRDNRAKAKEIDAEVKRSQPSLIASLQEIDPDNHGVMFDPEDDKRGAAYVQQNKGTDVWDEEAIIEWLKKDKSRWNSCSSRVFDVRKFEAEVANGNISSKTARKFTKTTEPPKPFIRFGKHDERNI